MRRGENRPVDAAGLRAVLDLLTPPFAAAARAEVVPVVDGIVDTGRDLRAPAVLVRLKVPLARRAVIVGCAVDRVGGGGVGHGLAHGPGNGVSDGAGAGPGGGPDDGAGHGASPAVFAAWSGAGSLLPLYLPEVPDGADGTGPVRLALAVRIVDGPAAHDPLAAASAASQDLGAVEAADLVEAVVIEGHLARLVHLLTSEKQRITTVAREIAASRHVSLARSGALDRIGADHGVPRLAGEDDDGYRNRLLVFTSWRLATPAGFELALNGVPDGSPGGGPNTGLPSTAGVTSRFKVVDQADELAVSVRLVEVGPPGPAPGMWRQRFLDLAHGGLLLDLETPPPARLPDATRARLTEVREVLRTNLARAEPLTERRCLAPLTAISLARAVLLLKALTGSGALTLLSALTRDADPRLDLGLGVTVEALTPARVDAAVAAARAAQQAAAAGGDPGLPVGAPPDVVGAALGAVVRDHADDPAARWLFGAAGLDASPLPDGSLYLTSLPSRGLVIEGPGRLADGETGRYVARMRGAGSGRHVLVDEVWGRAAPGLAHSGAPAPDPLDPAALDALLESVATAPPAVPAALQPLVAAGHIPATPGEFTARVREAYDQDLLLGVVVSPGAAGLAADDPAAVAARNLLVADLSVFTAAGFHAVRMLPHPDGASVVFLASVSLLPGGANRPGEPTPAMYRWYVAPFPPPVPGTAPGHRPLVSDRPTGVFDGTDDWSFRLGGQRLRRPHRWTPAPLEVRRGVGGRAELVATRPGIALVVCVAYVRRGLADPYEVRVELPDDAVLDLDQYAYLMNLLEELCPLGVEINTFDIRRNHVSPDGGPPVFLSGAVSRGYTRYRRRRAVGPERHGPPAD
ncbi:hypothetical protein ACFY2T_40885 [Streptomyces sp. NPDC001260]|uniref:hypothetical protein n=1 Tax=Streptomyces sp. NPDC001260 TaxID=3364551 RepID=UPI00369AFE99